ncbi:MAG: hypothetical protein SVV67_10560 [Bacillota bacterium]|nr:hypothetical protein [Bacillota bacterium]
MEKVVRDNMSEAYCLIHEQSILAEIGFDLLNDEITKEEAAIKLLGHIEDLGDRLPVFLENMKEGARTR